MLKLNQQTVRNWIDQGSLPAHRVGRRVRIRRSDLDRMLDEGYTIRAVPADPGTESDDAPVAGSTAGTTAAPVAGTSEPATSPATETAANPTAEDFWGGELADPWDGTPVTAPPLDVAAAGSER